MVLSKNGAALIVMILSLLGVNVAEGDLITTIGVIGQVVSVLLMTWNQYSRSDIKGFLFKG
jgi:hypothetical protein